MIELDISNYNKPYDALNGQKQLRIRPIDLARAILTVGHGGWNNVFKLGFFRIGELICKAFAFSKIDNNNLALQDRFFSLNQSEKTTVSYYFGQGFTKLYAEEYLKVKWLFHVDDYVNCIQFHIKGTALPKYNIGRKSIKSAERPDLIGLEKKNTSHIFEAKGNSSGYDKTVMQHAINQVSQVKSYNNTLPSTRTACYFDLSADPIKGIIIDPEEDEDGIVIEFNEELAISQYYNFFKENSQYFFIRISLDKYEFQVVPIGIPSMYFGFDRRILDLSPNTILSDGLYNEDFISSINNNSEQREISLGYDGIIVIMHKPGVLEEHFLPWYW